MWLEARWQSPIGDAPALTDEQTSQEYSWVLIRWVYNWNESTGQSWDIENTLAIIHLTLLIRG